MDSAEVDMRVYQHVENLRAKDEVFHHSQIIVLMEVNLNRYDTERVCKHLARIDNVTPWTGDRKEGHPGVLTTHASKDRGVHATNIYLENAAFFFYEHMQTQYEHKAGIGAEIIRHRMIDQMRHIVARVREKPETSIDTTASYTWTGKDMGPDDLAMAVIIASDAARRVHKHQSFHGLMQRAGISGAIEFKKGLQARRNI